MKYRAEIFEDKQVGVLLSSGSVISSESFGYTQDKFHDSRNLRDPSTPLTTHEWLILVGMTLLERKSEFIMEKLRKIRSFVRREGKITPSQKKALEEVYPKVGLDFKKLFDENESFGKRAELIVEIGFGMGDSLIELAKENPEKHFVGIEVYRPGVGKMLMNMQKHGLDNVRVYCEDAVEILKDCFKDQSIDALLLFFPDPWHKKRHNKRRIVQPEFVKLVHSKLKPGGVFHMATDWENYAEHMQEVMAEFSEFEKTDPLYRPNTKYEKRGERLGHGVWDLAYKSCGDLDTEAHASA